MVGWSVVGGSMDGGFNKTRVFKSPRSDIVLSGKCI